MTSIVGHLFWESEPPTDIQSLAYSRTYVQNWTQPKNELEYNMRVQLEQNMSSYISVVKRAKGAENDITSQHAKKRNKLRVGENIIDFMY